DITSSGETLRANHLKILSDGLILASQATLWRSRTAQLEDADRAALRDEGLSDRDIWDLANVAAFFNMSNRVASATAMQPNAEYHGQAR
ncbi:MAG: hypothetical protein AAFR10_21840, partial [Pseudomonadota bacterium]